MASHFLTLPAPPPPPHRFIKGTTATRNQMLKLIPHVAEGSWIIKQSVGTTPAILGKVRAYGSGVVWF